MYFSFKLSHYEIRKLRIRYDIGILAQLFGVFWCGITGLGFFTYLWYKEYGWDGFGPWQIILTLHNAAWATLCGNQVTLQFLLFYCTCCMYNLKLEKCHRDFITALSIVETKIGVRMLDKTLNEFMIICRDIQKSNRFWSQFLGISYFIYITTFTILLFDVVFTDIPFISKTMWFAIMLYQGAFVFLMAYSGDIVSRKVSKPFKALSSMTLKQMSLRLKLKVVI